MPLLLTPRPFYLSLLLAAVAGALAVLGFAPFSIAPMPVVALAVLFQVLIGRRPGQAALIGLAFGIALMGLGVSWVRISLNEFGNLDAWIANLLAALFVLIMASYYALLGWLLAVLSRQRCRWTTPILLFPALYLLLELLRGWLFSGFPWLVLGTSQVDTPLAGYAPLIGANGLTLVLAVSAGLLWSAARWDMRRGFAALLGLLAIWIIGAGLDRYNWGWDEGAPIRVAVVQANTKQSAAKWDPDELLPTLKAHLELTRERLDEADLIVWPETAVPAFRHEVERVLFGNLQRTAEQEHVQFVIGIPVMEPDGRYYNALVSTGSADDTYFKRHLVPFGEFMPLKAWLGPLADLFDVPMSSFSPGEGNKPLLQVGKHSVGVAICYEDVFPDEFRQAIPEARYLINVSNDSWFGDSLAPHQHLQAARMRAMELKRWLVRATNTGVSAIIDERGRVVAEVPLFVRGTAVAKLQPRSGRTPFAVFGSWTVIIVALLMLLIAVGLEKVSPREKESCG